MRKMVKAELKSVYDNADKTYASVKYQVAGNNNEYILTIKQTKNGVWKYDTLYSSGDYYWLCLDKYYNLSARMTIIHQLKKFPDIYEKLF